MLRLLLALVLLAPVAFGQEAERPQSLVLMIADGFGPAAATLAREAQGAPLVLDGILRGSVGTPSSDSRVTDSAAGATAYASGLRTYNGAIGLDALGRPAGTLLEAARERGMATGLVATSTLSHATPAAFAAHVPSRSDEPEIARQMMEQRIDVLLGGGADFFRPEPEGKRKDGRDLAEEARAEGYDLLATPAALAAADETPLLGLFAPGHMSYEIDRDEAQEPSLAEMTRKALELLGRHEGGFFLMVEGSRIDHAAHRNDPATLLHEVLAYDEAVGVALAFAREHGRTLVVSVADHETGGMTLGRSGVRGWHPEPLARVEASAGRLAARARERAEAPGTSLAEAVEAVLREAAGLDSLSAEEREGIEPEGLTRQMGHLVSHRAGIGWTTGGHTGVDVNLYASGPGSERLTGAMRNDAVGRTLADLLGLDLGAVTERLRAEAASE